MIEPNQIHQLDCFSALPSLADQSVDVLLTDPPYPNRMNLFPETLTDGLAMLYYATRKTKRYVVFFWNPFDVPQAPPGWHEVARHVWHKPDSKSITHYEVVVVWSREPKQKVSRVWSIPILDYRSLKDWKPHPTQKPVKLVRYLLDLYTSEGDVVLDPFVGSGTTAVACKQLNRTFYAFERDEKFAQIAQARLAATWSKKTGALPPEEDTATDDPEHDVPPVDGLPEHPDDDLPIVETTPPAAPKKPPVKRPGRAATKALAPRPTNRWSRQAKLTTK